MFKASLTQLNRKLVRYEGLTEKQSMWNFLHRWNYEHTWVKNILKITNKILRGLNKYHIFRWDWMVGLLGCGTGLIVTWMQEAYYNAKIGFKPMISSAVISGVLKNQIVKDKLKTILNENVFTNQQIQFYIHQTLLNQVLHPQKQSIKVIIRSSISSLNDPQTHSLLTETLAPFLVKLKDPIQSAALGFLNSEKMDSITANGLNSVLQSLYLKKFIGEQVREALNNYLKDKKNVESLYSGLRQNFIF